MKIERFGVFVDGKSPIREWQQGIRNIEATCGRSEEPTVCHACDKPALYRVRPKGMRGAQIGACRLHKETLVRKSQ